MIEKIIKKAISFLGVSEPTGDDQFIKLYNELTGAGFSMSVAWCAIFVTAIARLVGAPTSLIPTFASCDAGEDVQQGNEPERVKEQTGRFNITVVCEGSLRLRRSASFTIDNECGRASKGQTYIGKRIFMCDGLPMVETIDGLFLSAAACHVSIEKVG